MADPATGDVYERGLAMQRALPGHGEEPRRRHRLLRRGESAGDWAGVGDVSDFGPFGWFLGTLAGLLGWVVFRRWRTNADDHR